MTYKTIVLSGGGSSGIAFLGALHHLIDVEKLDLENVDEFVGTSIGSVISLLLLIGYSPLEILDEVLEIDQFFVHQKSTNMIANFGAFRIDGFIDHVQRMLQRRGWKTVPTFCELYKKTGKTLIISGVNITKCQIEYFSHLSTPTMLCTDAIKISCNVPLIFQKITYNNDLYVDGGLLDHFPLDIVNDGKKRILAVCLSNMNPIEKPDSFSPYMFTVMSLPLLLLAKVNSCTSQNVTRIMLYPNAKKQTKPSRLIGLDLEAQNKYDLFFHGYVECSHFYEPLYLKVDL